MSLEGQHLGEFEILERIGQGGMGAVYKARQTSLRRLVALKTLQASLAGDGEYIARFQQEALAAAVLNHPNLVQVISAGESDGLHWFAMEYVEGESAKVRLTRKGRLDPLEAMAIVIHVATALEYGWRKASLIHRDIKPDNIFLSSDGEVKLGDLGLAKSAGQTQGLTVTGHSMGTPHYISPEQVEAMKDVDLRADIYSLGCTLYHMLGGKPPFDGNSPVSIMMKHVTGPVPDLRRDWPECPPELAGVVGKMMQKAPDEREQSYEELIADLRHVYDVVSGKHVAEAVVGTPRRGVHAADAASDHGGRRGAPSLPVARKSKLPLYAGIGIGVVALAVAGFLLFKPKDGDANPGGTRSVASQTSAGEGGKREGADRAAPSTATKDAPFVNSLGMKFVPVPGTKVLFSVWDTRVQDYAAFAKETKREWPKADFEQGPTHPAVNVTWEDATAFCAWLSEREQKSGELPANEVYRLPSDHEWSCAVGIGEREDAAKLPVEKSEKINDAFPWGTQWPPPERAGNYASEELKPLLDAGKYPYVKDVIPGYRDGYANTSPVGSYAANPFGLYDMGGNVWQWCEGWFDQDHKERVQRGASWDNNDRDHVLSSKRSPIEATARGNHYGFRCVLDPAPSPTPAAVLDRGAIKLWDSPGKITGSPSARWEDGAMRLDGSSPKVEIQGRDGIIRARIRRNPDSGEVQLGLRVRGGHYYRLTLHFTNVELFAIAEGGPQRIAQWPLPRAFGPDEWPLLEFKAVGDELSARIDGQLLGTVHDTALPNAGSVTAFATRAGYFRDAAYVPLDKSGAPTSTAAP